MPLNNYDTNTLVENKRYKKITYNMEENQRGAPSQEKMMQGGGSVRGFRFFMIFFSMSDINEGIWWQNKNEKNRKSESSGRPSARPPAGEPLHFELRKNGKMMIFQEKSIIFWLFVLVISLFSFFENMISLPLLLGDVPFLKLKKWK